MVVDFISKELEALQDAGLYRRLRRVEGDQGATLTLDGREVINFSSNNYLGIANHPALAAAAKVAIDLYGCGSGASRLISGNMTLHEELEATLAKFKNTEAALVFNSGFQANIGILSTSSRRRRCDSQRWAQSREHHRRLPAVESADLGVRALRSE